MSVSKIVNRYVANDHLQNRQEGLCLTMKRKTTVSQVVEQPKPFTPGIAQSMVREHAYHLYRDKLTADVLTLEDWVLAEKDLVAMMEAEEEGVVV